MTRTTSEGFIVVECALTGTPTGRMWILHSDVDANILAMQLRKSSWNVDRFEYAIRRANVTEYETK